MNCGAKSYKPDEIPKKIVIESFLCYEIRGYNQGKFGLWDCDVSGQDRILISTQNVTINLPKELDLKEKLLESLESEKSRLLADTHMKVKEIQEQINELLCLEYKPLKVVGGSDADLPF